LYSTGTVFVPKAYAQGKTCGVVLALHSCKEYSAFISNRWVTQAGINEWANINNLVVIYPHTVASSTPGPTNPNGCCEWLGYSNQIGPQYSVKSGAQMSVLYGMVQPLKGRLPSTLA
jgi:poly(3-hydroxybutyrate) depolymerase